MFADDPGFSRPLVDPAMRGLVLTVTDRLGYHAEIATELFIGETTVKTHVGRTLMKLDLRDRVQAAILAHEAGLG